MTTDKVEKKKKTQRVMQRIYLQAVPRGVHMPIEERRSEVGEYPLKYLALNSSAVRSDGCDY